MSQVIAYLDCHSGISGDMFLASLLDAGLVFDELRAALAALPFSDYQLTYERFSDKGIRGSRFDVQLSTPEQPTRHLADIQTLIQASTLPPQVRERALAVFQLLAEAEAHVHGTSIAEVHFHEVGAVDAIVDIVGAVWAIERLGIGQIYASALPLSSGHVKTAHGLLPVPAPATLEILSRVSAPWKPSPAEGEMVTPTGAALLATFARFEQPAIAIERVGYGFGRKQFPWPNCLRLCLGRSLDVSASRDDVPDTDWVGVLECNIDNMTGELLGDLMERVLSAGALDISYLPLQMKKNRPAVMVTLICQVEDIERLTRLVLSETSTLGVRVQQVQRRKAQRSQEQIITPLGPLQIKLKRLGTRVISAAPEYEDCRRLARARQVPLEEVYELARQVIARTILSLEENSTQL
ncbi:MAG TPA: nickel pincer cofactor biosynthesis protein LarC [Ktedonobacteraceae bacterium]|nr:nickel pincer cofactor biosynthesis protein LarC [Ktedonobacteraceae bacterium]